MSQLCQESIMITVACVVVLSFFHAVNELGSASKIASPTAGLDVLSITVKSIGSMCNQSVGLKETAPSSKSPTIAACFSCPSLSTLFSDSDLENTF